MEPHQRTGFCHNKFTGINHLIRRETKNAKCEDINLVPTRKNTIGGKILTNKAGARRFISDEHKMFFQLNDKISSCGCSDTYTTDYEGLFLRTITASCSTLPNDQIPPASVNLEFHQNIKV